MTFPVRPGKLDQDGIVTPAEMLAHRRQGGRLPRLPDLDAAVLCLQRGLPERLRRQVRLRRLGRLMGPLYLVRGRRRSIAVLTDFGLGAPIVAAQAEELIALGARRLVSVALAGGIQPGLAPGALVVPDEAVRDEGTSYHYLPSDVPAAASTELAGALAAALGDDAHRGRTWSTDAPYRETRGEVLSHQAAGVLTVDMELAALLAVAATRDVSAAGVLVVGDSLAGGEWMPPVRLDVMERSLVRAYRAAIEVLDAS
jgi:uridine phosphorylase